MAKFAGFTPQQQYLILQKGGYNGPFSEAEMDKYLQATPSAAASLGRYVEIARQKVEKMPNAVGVETPTVGMASGGLVATAGDPKTQDKTIGELYQQTPQDMAKSAAFRPTAEGNATSPDVATTQYNSNQLINPKDSNLKQGKTPDSKASTATAATAATPQQTAASQVDPTLIGDKAQSILDNTQAATAEPSAKATVQGQLESLMKDFEDGTPPWAAGAMRAATATMQRRGLGASSMAGQAIVQAAMEAALPIASADAQVQAQFEMQNLNNEQQTTIFKTQQSLAALFTDQAQENAAKQFNASSEQQNNQFFAQLESTASQFNAAQINAIRQFNAGESNAMKKFNQQLENQRDQFNASQSLVIAQANAKWRQDLALTNTKAQNDANLEYARAANSLSQQALDFLWQQERDQMAFAFTASESEKDRAMQLLLGNKQISAQSSSERLQALGYVVGKVIGSDFF